MDVDFTFFSKFSGDRSFDFTDMPTKFEFDNLNRIGKENLRRHTNFHQRRLQPTPYYRNIIAHDHYRMPCSEKKLTTMEYLSQESKQLSLELRLNCPRVYKYCSVCKKKYLGDFENLNPQEPAIKSFNQKQEKKKKLLVETQGKSDDKGSSTSSIHHYITLPEPNFSRNVTARSSKRDFVQVQVQSQTQTDFINVVQDSNVSRGGGGEEDEDLPDLNTLNLMDKAVNSVSALKDEISEIHEVLDRLNLKKN